MKWPKARAKFEISLGIAVRGVKFPGLWLSSAAVSHGGLDN